MLDSGDIALRLVAATVAGGTIGLNRDLHGKPIGVRTLGLVCLGCATAIIAVYDIGNGQPDPNAASRVMQGVLTGIGFLGGGDGVVLGQPVQHIVAARAGGVGGLERIEIVRRFRQSGEISDVGDRQFIQ